VVPEFITNVVVVLVTYTMVAEADRAAVSAFAGCNITFGACPYAVLKVTVAIAAFVPVGKVPVVTFTIPERSVAFATETVGEVPAPAPAAMVGAAELPAKWLS
jgi:hypothetical protein